MILKILELLKTLKYFKYVNGVVLSFIDTMINDIQIVSELSYSIESGLVNCGIPPSYKLEKVLLTGNVEMIRDNLYVTYSNKKMLTLTLVTLCILINITSLIVMIMSYRAIQVNFFYQLFYFTLSHPKGDWGRHFVH